MEKIVKLKDGTYATVIKEWNWLENPQMKIMTEDRKERIFDDFLDIELSGQLKVHKLSFGPLPVHSDFHHVYMTICRKDVEFIYG